MGIRRTSLGRKACASLVRKPSRVDQGESHGAQELGEGLPGGKSLSIATGGQGEAYCKEFGLDDPPPLREREEYHADFCKC